MQSFLTHHASNVQGVLSGFDRIRFRGTLRHISYTDGFFKFLCFIDILLKHFKAFVDGTTRKLRRATERLAKQTPAGKVVYLSGTHDKEQVVQELLRKHGTPETQTGLLAVLSCVENCCSYEIHKNAVSQKLELQSAFRKCLHYYLYIRDPRLGMLHLRIMTWFPMRVQICLNGREWLARQLDAAGIAYERLDNTFRSVSDFPKAQELFDQQLQTDWSAMLSGLLRTYHPDFAALIGELRLRDYYWSAEQTEWATDVAFTSAEALAALYPRLVHHGITTFGSPNVLRFLQQKVTRRGGVSPRLKQEVVSSLTTRMDGTRIKHSLGANSVKMYDKFACVLRVETTIHRAEGLKVYRPVEGNPGGGLAWRPLRRGVADLYRRCELSQRANAAYLEALAAVESTVPLRVLTEPLSQAKTLRGRRYRGLNLLSEADARVLTVIARGEFAILGIRNRDVRQGIYGDAKDAEESRRQSNRVTRLLGLLRAHGLIVKVQKSHRYQLTEAGRKLVAALSAARSADVKRLAEAA